MGWPQVMSDGLIRALICVTSGLSLADLESADGTKAAAFATACAAVYPGRVVDEPGAQVALARGEYAGWAHLCVRELADEDGEASASLVAPDAPGLDEDDRADEVLLEYLWGLWLQSELILRSGAVGATRSAMTAVRKARVARAEAEAASAGSSALTAGAGFGLRPLTLLSPQNLATAGKAVQIDLAFGKVLPRVKPGLMSGAVGRKAHEVLIRFPAAPGTHKAKGGTIVIDLWMPDYDVWALGTYEHVAQEVLTIHWPTLVEELAARFATERFTNELPVSAGATRSLGEAAFLQSQSSTERLSMLQVVAVAGTVHQRAWASGVGCSGPELVQQFHTLHLSATLDERARVSVAPVGDVPVPPSNKKTKHAEQEQVAPRPVAADAANLGDNRWAKGFCFDWLRGQECTRPRCLGVRKHKCACRAGRAGHRLADCTHALAGGWRASVAAWAPMPAPVVSPP